ncbi:MAG TPA: fumarylacetoacetase [Phycisphaerales bacterium]|nr:fumarylacetoacetase [Phycisphaerales bacterium]
MPYDINETHDPKLESWVESANDPGTDFPIQNLPFCSFIDEFGDEYPGLRIGDEVVNLHWLAVADLLPEGVRGHLHARIIDDFNILTLEQRVSLRALLSNLLRAGQSRFKDWPKARALFKLDEVSPVLSAEFQNYTDFYASIHHATNVGSMFRPDNPLLPNYKHMPIGYHGRASSIVPSGTPIRRPVGQQDPPEPGSPANFGPCKMLDYELELGAVIGRGNALGAPIEMEDAEDHVFGMCIVNDWSARDIQRWEYQPLGPFLAKNFATSVSPYVVTMEALAPFRCPPYARPEGDPRPLPYLDSEHNRSRGGIDITCEAYLASAEMRKRGLSPVRLSKGSFKHMYWTLAQFVAHHTVNGCNLQPGDLLASGTISGPTRDSRGCLLELTWDGDPWASPPTVVPGSQRTPIKLPTGEERKFLADGDEVIIKAYCEREGFRRIGFGECRGVIEPAVSPTEKTAW